MVQNFQPAMFDKAGFEVVSRRLPKRVSVPGAAILDLNLTREATLESMNQADLPSGNLLHNYGKLPLK